MKIYPMGGGRDWQLTVFKETGTTRMAQLDGSMTGMYSDYSVNCNKDVFQIVKPSTYMDGSWESSITKINLKLGACEKNNTREECEIEISEEVGLKWKLNPKPKVFFLVTS